MTDTIFGAGPLLPAGGACCVHLRAPGEDRRDMRRSPPDRGWPGVRGRMGALVVALCLAGPTILPAAAQEGPPSGQPIVLWEIVWERVEGSGAQAVLRFIAPGIARDGGNVTAEQALADLDWLCATHGIPVAALPSARADRVVVTLMDRPVPRGTTDAAATQFFGLYSMKNGECSPEDY